MSAASLRSGARPIRIASSTPIDFTQELADHGVLASVGSVGDACDNAMAEPRGKAREQLRRRG